METDWVFPSANGGRSHGFKEAGLSTFSGNPLPSLVREICQNSLDAALGNKAVRIEFETYEIEPNKIPGYKSFSQAVGRSLPYWHGQANQEILAYLKNANSLLKKASLFVLRAGDFHTTGLHGAYKDRIDDWARLTKMDGGATKSGTSAGSYGIGKNAPFVASALRMVFYRTLTDEQENQGRAAQGIAYVPAYPLDIQKELSTQTLGIGYYGNPGENKDLSYQPVPSIALLDDLNIRSEIGTDIFVYGFQTDEENWMQAVAAEVLENFILAIYKGQLEICISEGKKRIEITQGTLPSVLKELTKKAKNAASYYKVLIEPESKVFRYNFHGKGTLRLQLLADVNEELNRKILVCRTNNMKILAIDRFPKGLNFSGILELEGEELNKYFRALESPTHDSWEPARYTENRQEAAAYISELKKWVKNTVRDAVEVPIENKTEVKGLSRNFFAPDHGNAFAKQRENAGSEVFSGHIRVKGKAEEGRPANIIITRDGAEVKENGDTGVLSGHGSHQLPRNKTKRKPKKRKTRGKGSTDIQRGKCGGNKPRAVPVISSRLIRTGKNKGRLILEVPWSIARGSIHLHVIGENNREYEGIAVREVRSLFGPTQFTLTQTGIRFENLNAKAKTGADIVFENDLLYSIGVSLYEDK